MKGKRGKKFFMQEEWDVVEILKKVRHDSLNHIQIVKGYLALEKIDKAKEALDHWTDRLRKESALSGLKGEKLPVLLLTYPYRQWPVRLEYELIGDGKSLRIEEERLAEWLENFLRKLNRSASWERENVLTLEMHFREKETYFSFLFRGSLNDPSFLKEIEQATEEPLYIDHAEDGRNRFSFELRWNENGKGKE
jgi:stage 0 sporulation protein B (sporulation initiation phosphotransferase)|nr:hypothetical protein [Bacillaceae bacterium]